MSRPSGISTPVADVHSARGVLERSPLSGIRLLFLGGVVLLLCVSWAVGQIQPNPATDITAARNASMYQVLDFNDQQDFEDATRGFIAGLEPPRVIYNDIPQLNPMGFYAWNLEGYQFFNDFAVAPPSVNPSLWRQERLNNINGLFVVVQDCVYQVRSYELATMSLRQDADGLDRDRSADQPRNVPRGPGAVASPRFREHRSWPSSSTHSHHGPLRRHSGHPRGGRQSPSRPLTRRDRAQDTIPVLRARRLLCGVPLGEPLSGKFDVAAGRLHVWQLPAQGRARAHRIRPGQDHRVRLRPALSAHGRDQAERPRARSMGWRCSSNWPRARKRRPRCTFSSRNTGRSARAKT